jgi:hypothetical protein
MFFPHHGKATRLATVTERRILAGVRKDVKAVPVLATKQVLVLLQ